MKYRTAIFDLDGTLLNTLEDLWRSVNFALQTQGLPLRTMDEVRSFVGNGIATLIERACGVVEEGTQKAVLAAFKAHYGEHCEDNTKPYEGIMELLRELKAEGVVCGVVSNKADFAVKKLVKSYFGELFATAVGENEGEGIRKKPAPDTLLAVMRELGADGESTVYIGDSEVDIQTARNAAVDCISVTWGFKDRAFLLREGATRLVDTPKEVLL